MGTSPIGRDCNYLGKPSPEYGPPTALYLFELIAFYRRQGGTYREALDLARSQLARSMRNDD